MKFNSAKEMLDCIQKGCDLYNPNLELYVFVYNDSGSIAYYDISKNDATELVQKVKESEEYWGSLLGPGGRIVDAPTSEFYIKGKETNLQWCKKYYKEDGWVNTNDYS